MAPFGSVFWFRTKALKSLFDYGWDYQDFPAEPVEVDGTLLHALERIYPFVAQQAGYFAGWLQSSSYAAVHLTNYHYMQRQLNLRLLPICGSRDFAQLVERAERLIYPSWRLLYRPLKLFLQRALPDRWYRRLVKVKTRVFREM